MASQVERGYPAQDALDMQLKTLHKEYDSLQLLHGDRSLQSIYGAGCIKNPKVMFIFMNPTAKNVSAQKNWQGLRAPWLGTKNVWNIFYELRLLSENYYKKIKEMRPDDWTNNFAKSVYSELKNKKVFVTNLAKCTQLDARPLSNETFKQYLNMMFREILLIKPCAIVSFGNQVSSILLEKPVSVSKYTSTRNETLKIGDKVFKIYPTYYPVGQGRRNMELAIERIKEIIKGK